MDISQKMLEKILWILVFGSCVMYRWLIVLVVIVFLLVIGTGSMSVGFKK